MKKLIKKILHFVFNAKNEKLILFALPSISILIAALVLIPIFSSLNDSISQNKTAQTQIISNQKEPVIQVIPNNSDTTEVLQTPLPSESLEPVNETEKKNIHLTASSTEKDLYIFIRGEDNKPVSGEVFKVIVNYPNGQIGSYKSQTDGSCYLINLNAGTYSVSLEDKAGYNNPEKITCEVYDSVPYSYIEDIENIVEITDVSEIIEEVKTNTSEATEETVAEVITTDSDSQDQYIRDDKGNIKYVYNWEEDDEGHLLDSSGNPTDVFPYYEDEGVLLWGFRLEGTSTLEEIQLINSDNTPVSGYAITATPLTKNSVIGWNTQNGNISYILEDGSKAKGLKNIDGKLYYFDMYGNKASSIGIDVSFYNGTINWSTVKNSGIDFVIIRLGGRGWGTGALYDDSCFYNYLNGAKAAGLKVGVYFYSTATSKVEAVQEASIALDRLNGCSLDYPVFIDMEYSNDYPNGRADRLSRAERVEICTAFCETIKSANYKPGLYSSQSFLWEGIDYNSISQYCIWMASYTQDNRLPDTSYNYSIWQISDRGRIPGINGNCDINIILQ